MAKKILSIYGHSGVYNSLIDTLGAKRTSLKTIVNKLTAAKPAKGANIKRKMLGHIGDHANFLMNTSSMSSRIGRVSSNATNHKALMQKASDTGKWLLAEIKKSQKTTVIKRNATNKGANKAQGAKVVTAKVATAK